MAFLNSIWLWGSLAAAGVAVPIIIHLLNRYKHRTVPWAAMELLRKALVVRSRQVRLEDLLLLLLRCLALLLLALALSRPTLRGQSAQLFGGPRQVGVVIAVDASYSMNHRGVSSRFDRAKDRVRDLLATLESGYPVTLMLMGDQPEVLLRNVGFDRDRFIEALDEAQPLPEGLALEPNLEQIESIVEELKTPVREVYLVTDGQALTWRSLTDTARQSLMNLDQQANVLLCRVASEGAANLTLNRFDLASGTLRQGTTARYVAVVTNHGESPVTDAAVTLEVDGQAVDRRPLGLVQPGQTASLPLFVRFEGSGGTRLTARLSGDALTTDNQRHAVAYVRTLVRVLVVDGDPSDQPYESETDFLVAALQPSQRGGGAALQVNRINWLDLPNHRLGDYDVVMMANVVDIHPEQLAGLTEWVKAGGGLMLFVGDNVDPRVFNARLNRGRQPLSPLAFDRLVEATGEQRRGWSMQAAERDHRLAGVLAGLPADLVESARLRKYLAGELTEGATALWRLAGTRTPVLAERTVGRGRVIVFAATADRAWTDIPVFPMFPMLLHEAVTHLTSPAYERQLTVNEALMMSLPRRPLGGEVAVTTPDGRIETVAVTERDGRPIVELESTAAPGFYEIAYADDAPRLTVAVNVDPLEGAAATLDRAATASALAGLNIAMIDPGDDMRTMVAEARVGRELWKELLIAALLLLLAESLLARWFSMRMRKGGLDREQLLPTRGRGVSLGSTNRAA